MNVNHVKRCLLRIVEQDVLLTMWQWTNFIDSRGKENTVDIKKMALKFKTQGVVNHDRLLCRIVRGGK